MLKLYLTIDKSKECVIAAAANIVAGMDVCTSLANDNVACEYCLTVCLLYAKALGLTVTAVLCRTNTLLMSKKLKTNSKPCYLPPLLVCL